MRGTVWFSEFPNGGFANTVFQYIFSVYLKESLDVEVLYGRPGHNEDALCWEMFDIPKLDPERYERELKRYAEPETKFLGATFKKKRKVLQLSENRRVPPSNDLNFLHGILCQESSKVVMVDGYFQYDTQLIAEDLSYFEIFSRECDPQKGLSNFSRSVRGCQEKLSKAVQSRVCFAIHIRRGDYLAHDNNVCYQLDLKKCLKQVGAWCEMEALRNPILYVASDDPDYCRNFFFGAPFSTLDSRYLSPVSASASELLIGDISALAFAERLVISNSSFSMLASLMNKNCKQFLRQTQDGELLSFRPWQTKVLLGL